MKLAKIGDKLASVDGKLLKVYQFPTAKLLADFCVMNDAVYNLAKGKKFTKFTAEDGGFHGNGSSNIISGNTLSSFTIVMIADRPLAAGNTNYFTVNNATYPVRVTVSNARGQLVDFSKSMSPTQFFGQFEYTYAKLSPQLLTVETDEFFAYSRNADEQTILIQQNEVQTIETYTDEVPDLTSIKLLSNRTYKRFMVYDGALSAEEIQQICEIRYGENTTKYYPEQFAQGINSLGCPNGYYALSSQIPVWDDSVEFTVIEQENPVVGEDMSGFTALYFINPISELEVGKKYNLEAHPYPYDVTATPFNVEYESDNVEVLECYKGFLIAKAVGTATITAKISNTEITATQEIVVREVQEIEKNYRYLEKSYNDGTNALLSEDSEEVLKAMISAIYETAEKGFNGIVFPKRTYHIKPFQQNTHCHVPTNFTIDFNGSTIYIDDNEYCHCEAGAVDAHNDGYTLFKFGQGDYDDYYGEPCEYSIIRNAKVYGERYENTTYAENEYTEFVKFVTFGCRSVGCKVTDMYFEATCGFHIDTATNGYKYWSGTGLDGARRGCTLAEDYAQGRIAEDGETITDESGWYYTTDFIKIGYYYGTGSYTSILQYKVGLMGYMTYGTTGRWYDIFFYDENYNLVEKGIHQFGLEPYDFPENAVYMKVNIMTNSTPADNTTTDVPAVVRLHPAVEPDLFEISNCKFINPHASAISLTGGVRGIIENCYTQQGARYGWSIDFEDGWLAMRHNMMYRVLCDGQTIFPAGHNTAVVSCAIGTMHCLGDTEGLRLINGHYGVLRLKTKTNDVVECVTQDNLYSAGYQYQYEGVSTLREINNTVW